MTLSTGGWRVLAAVEVALAAVAVVGDWVLPTLVLLVLAGGSLLIRRDPWSSLGFHRLSGPLRIAGQILLLTCAWTVVQLSLIMPIAERVTGERQDLAQFADLEGNLPMLAGLLLISWTLAAVGEETAYRGYLLTRLRQLLGAGPASTVAAVLASSVLFGLAHTEQGEVGVALTFFDAIFFGVLRLRFGTVWAPVLAHGFNNTIGLTGVLPDWAGLRPLVMHRDRSSGHSIRAIARGPGAGEHRQIRRGSQQGEGSPPWATRSWSGTSSTSPTRCAREPGSGPTS